MYAVVCIPAAECSGSQIMSDGVPTVESLMFVTVGSTIYTL
jgi:hypothetical protein